MESLTHFIGKAFEEFFKDLASHLGSHLGSQVPMLKLRVR